MRPSTAAKRLYAVAFVVSASACLFALAYSLATANIAALGSAEAELVFEAKRLRNGLSIYVDPLVGAMDYGPVPTRHYALYTPLWTRILSLAPEGADRWFGRVVSTFAWFGALLYAGWTADKQRRRASLPLALAAGGLFLLVRGAVAARPDALAVALVAIALVRTVKTGRVDLIASTLWAVAVLLKPNVFGVAAGALAADVYVRRREGLYPALATAALIATGALAFHVWSNGAFWIHSARSTLYPLSFERGLVEVGSRLPFLGIPHAAVIAVAWRARRDSPHALAALFVSTTLTIVSMAKSGSATNYWLEPTLAAVVVVAHVEHRAGPAFAQHLAPVGVAVFSMAVAFASVPAIVAAWRSAHSFAAAIATAKDACRLRATDVVLSTEPGVELEVNGRIVMPAFENSHLVRAGKFPLALWAADVARPEVVCFISLGDELWGPPPVGREARIETSVYGIELNAEMRRLFALHTIIGPLVVYRRRASAE